jgi:hypothetical protein
MFDPFDFSDFGSPPTTAAAPTAGFRPQAGTAAVGAPRQDANLDTGFDPFLDVPPRQAKSHDVLGATTSWATESANSLTVARPPLALFGLAIALAAAGAVIAGVWGDALAAACVGWILAGPLAIGLLAIYTLVDTQRRTNAVYSAPSWIGAVYWTVVAMCLTGISISAWHLALWAGRW